MTQNNTTRFFIAMFTVVLSVFSASAQKAETPLMSRLAVVATETKTNIWVSDFPKSTTVVLFDEEDNLITMVSTNEFGAAYVSLPQGINKTIFAKTMNGEIKVSNKAEATIKNEQNIASKNEATNNNSKA